MMMSKQKFTALAAGSCLIKIIKSFDNKTVKSPWANIKLNRKT